jgi:demethylmenaquinone methyltransferase / 2-methoxy-6-polyprenyl-1,4-benzoquinol methylase
MSARPTANSDAQTHFGFTTVPMSSKQALVDDVFHKVALRYDIMNDLMSGGLHRWWKDALVTKAHLPRGRAFEHLDVAGGTGDVAFRIAEAAGASAHSIILDVNGDMLDVGRKRAAERGLASRVSFIEGNAEALPFSSNKFDLYTIAFGIRNVPRIEQALAEAHRVLRVGGRFLCLEFSKVDVPGLDRLYEEYSFKAIPFLGRLVAGEADPYRYLVESIREFATPERFRSWIVAAGFRRCVVTPMTGGVVAIHSGWKL